MQSQSTSQNIAGSMQMVSLIDLISEIHEMRLMKETNRFSTAFGRNSQPPKGYMSLKNRIKLVDYINISMRAYNILDPRTFFLAIQLIDRVMHKVNVGINNLQLVG
jgi:hypothetical protein